MISQTEPTDEWEKEEVQSEPEITLVKFKDDCEEGENGDVEPSLEGYSLEERKNLVVDRNTGNIIDLREEEEKQVKSAGQFEQRRKLNNGESVWDDFWQQSQKIHQQLLMSICQKNHKALSDLLNHKSSHLPVNINYRSFDNWTPLHFAVMHDNVYALELLLSYQEVSFNALTNFHWNPVHIAAKNNHVECLKLLLKVEGIDVDGQDQDGNTPLHYAAQFAYKEVAEMLIQHGVNVKLKNRMGYTPANLATSSEMLKFFHEGENNKSLFENVIRSNRHIQKLLMRINMMQKEKKKEPKKKPIPPPSKEKPVKKMKPRHTNIVRMYQLLKEKKPVEKVSLSSFKFYRKIGEGAFGQVYIVKKLKSEKLYALKAIRKEKIFGTNLYRYIQTEKDILSLISHPFIVRLFFAFQSETYLFLVMEFCEGGDLGKLLQKKKRFEEDDVKKYAAEILLGVEALHKEKIIYRDLKPENIVLDKSGHAMLTDFGLSKKTNDLDDINKSFCGTPAYLPLEIINKKGHNRMVDWYEYGIVLYQLYTGIPPFYAETRTELYQNVRAGIIRFPRGTPEYFRDLIKKLLSQNPQKRLGYVNDAESIKQHPWFHDIDWEEVYARKQQMPPIFTKLEINEPIKTRFTQGKGTRNVINGWSFIAQ